MTLQQKLLAKQSKKGFTLVELVVVIAILGILAAIAIPAVIGIINSANESQLKTDAATVDAACKDYYAELVAGTINKSAPGKITSTTETGVLPAANDGTTARKTAALKCTIQGAMEYAGVTQLSNKLGDMTYDKEGTIFAKVDKSRTPVQNAKTLAATTTFSDLGYT